MTPSRLVLAFSCLSLGLVLARCGDDECKENCDDGNLVGLTVIAPDQLAQSTCAPAQIVQLDGGTTVRPTRDVRLALSGDASWYADASCSVPASTVVQGVATRGAVAYLSAKSAGRLRAQARGTDVGGEALLEARAISGTYTTIRVGGVRYADVGACVPIWLAAADASGAPAGVGGGVTVSLAAPGTTFFGTEGCTEARSTFSLTAGRESTIAYARFGVPGDITVTATVGGTAQGNARVDVAGDPQYRLAINPATDVAPITAGECKSFALSIVDQLGAPLQVSSIDVAVRGIDASVFADSACATPPISVARVSGVTPTTVYVRATRVGSASFTASLSESQSRTIQLQVSAGAASALRLGGAARLSQNGCYPFAVERTDAFGNLVNGPAITATLASTLGTFSDSNCTTATTAVSILAGESLGRFYLRGASLGAAIPLGATSSGLTAASKPVDVIAAASALRLELGSSAITGECVPGTLFSVNAAGAVSDVLAAESVSIAPTPSSLTAYADIDCAAPQGTVTIPALGSQVSFYVRSTSVASYSVTTTGGTLTVPGARLLQVRAGPPARLDVQGPDRANLRSCVAIDVELFDQFGNPTGPTNARYLDVVSGGYGTIHGDPTCASDELTELFIASGQQSAVAYYRGERLGNEVVNVGATDVTPDSVAFEVLLFMNDMRIPLADLPWAREVALRPDGALFAQTIDGMLHRSVDNGVTWERMCTTGQGSNLDGVGTIFVSPAPDGRAYVFDNYTNYYRIDSRGGATCPSIRTGPLNNATLYGYWETRGISVDGNGRLWAWAANQLHYSDDYGSTWNLYYTLPGVSTFYTASMVHSPLDPAIKLADFYFANSGGGLYQSLDGGASFTATSAPNFADTRDIPRFDPVNAGYVYKRGRQSIDNGLTWTANTGYDNLSLSWGLASNGFAYRFSGDSTTTVIESAPDARTPVWTALPGGTIAVGFNNESTQMSVASDGSSIALQTGGSLYLSRNAGTTFERIATPGTFDALRPAVVSSSRVHAYAASGDPVLIFATEDAGETWDRVGNYAVQITPVFHVNPKFPRTVYLRSEAFGGTYDTKIWATQDGFNTVNYAPDGGVSTWWGVGAISLDDPLVFYALGFGTCRRTLDGGLTYEERPCDVPEFQYVSPTAWVSPLSQDIVYYAGYDFNVGGPYLWRVSWLTGERTLVEVPDMSPTAIEVFDGPFGATMRIADVYGRLVTSTDGGSTFSSPTNGPFEEYCSYGRMIASLPGRPEVVASSCQFSSYTSISVDGGDTWDVRYLGDCQVRQVSLVEGVAIVSCLNRAALNVEYELL